jgi:hypothetical protein
MFGPTGPGLDTIASTPAGDAVVDAEDNDSSGDAGDGVTPSTAAGAVVAPIYNGAAVPVGYALGFKVSILALLVFAERAVGVAVV